MMLSFSLAWLGVGLLVFANPVRARQVMSLTPDTASAWLTRIVGGGVLLGSAWVLAAELGSALSIVAALIAAMVATSVAALLASVSPRLYAASLPVSALAAALAWSCS